jgi:hypothetical protein
MKNIIILLLLLVSTNLKAQNLITGKVIDSKTKEPVIAASVQSGKIGTTTDLNGHFQLTVKSLNDTLIVSYISYNKKIVLLKSKDINNLVIELQEETRTLDQVVVTAKINRETSSSLIIQQKKLNVVSDAISSETIKKTPDRTVGDVLKRVSGLSIQSDKFVTVRGLSDRYNVVLLNNSPLPSTEPDKRAFSFDIIPSTMIDNLIIIKSPMASLPGDFSGGIIQINTKTSDSKFTSIGFSSSFGSLTTFNQSRLINPASLPNDFPSTTKFRTLTNSEKVNLSNKIDNNSVYEMLNVPNLTISLTNNWISKNKKVNSTLSFSHRRTNSISYSERLDYFSSTEIAYRYVDTNYNNITSTNALWNLSYDGKLKLNFRNLFNYNNEKSLTLRSGTNNDNQQEISSIASNSTNKLVYTSQVDGKFKNLDFIIGYNFMNRNQPDYRIQPQARFLGSSDNMSTVWRDTYRFWSGLRENTVNLGLNYNYKKFKFGASNLFKVRSFDARIFRYDAPNQLNEITNNTDRYSANFNVLSGYLMHDNRIGRIGVNIGIRTENNTFQVLTADYSGRPIMATRDYLDLLPSTNLSYDLNEKQKVRFSFGQTIARPELREVANFAYYDFIRNAQIIGNPKLERTQISNFDLKYEIYPKSGEMISISAFYKIFRNPIEMIVDQGSVPSNLLLTYSNPKIARVGGIEIDVKKSITKWLSIFSNASLIYSQVSTLPSRQLQGQSPYLINTGLNFKKKSNSITVSYNRIGERISAVGFQGYSDIYENARDIFDLVYSKKLAKSGELKLSIIDLFSQNSRFYQKDRPLDLISTRNERLISIGYTHKF